MWFDNLSLKEYAYGWDAEGLPTLDNSTDKHSGSYAISVDGDSSNYLYQTVTVESGKLYTLSGWMKGTAGRIELSGAATKTINGSTNWRKHGHTFKAVSTSLTIKIYGNGAAALFDDFALIPVYTKEASTATPTPLANGYTLDKWGNNGRAYNFHGNSTVKYPTDGVLNTDLGTVVSLFKAPFAYNQYDDRDFYLMDIENVLRLWYDASELKFKFEIYNGSEWITCESQSQTFNAGDWLYVFGLFDNTNGITIYVNSTQGTTVGANWSAQALPADCFFWSDHNGQQQPDAIVDFAHGFNEWLGAAQIQSIVAGNWGSK